MDAYTKIVMQSDAAARTNFLDDPRVAMLAQRNASNNVVAFAGTRPNDKVEVDPAAYGVPVVGSHSDVNIVQQAPKTIPVKRYVIIDTSQRDWVKQPNPYANVTFTFGSQVIQNIIPPVYENNPFIPTFADEQANLETPVAGIPNLTGWTLSNVKYPGYNSSKGRGNFVGYDSNYQIQPSGSGFGSVFSPCNVASIRLIRAVLPQRQFLNVPVVPGSADSTAIQNLLVGKPYSTFSTYPYLLFYLNEYFGQYVGGNEPMRRCFSVMTQKTRTQTDFQTSIGVQQYDYEPWGVEALQFQSPITNLQRLQISVTDPLGVPFAQTDNLAISLIQATQDNMYLKCFTGSYQYFSSNELRPGDRITFYTNTLNSIMKSELLASLNPQKKEFITAITGATFPVLKLLDYVPDREGIFRERDVDTARADPYVSSYNGFLIPNFTVTDPQGNVDALYPDSMDAATKTVLEPNILIGSNLPFLNVSLQPTYTMELEVLQPDTGSIGGTVVF